MITPVYEIGFPQTEAAFVQLAANNKFSTGDHIDYHLTSGDIAMELGSEEFDPAYHDVADIDFSLEESLSSGDLYVPSGLVTRPLIVGIAQDTMTRSEDPRISAVKKSATKQLTASLQNSVPQTDPINGLIVTDLELASLDFQEISKVKNRNQGTEIIGRFAQDGLTLAISDFQDMVFAKKSLEGTVAIKMNHLFERELPQGIGMLALGGGVEINTNKPKSIRTYNQGLQDQHEEIVHRMKNAGALVVSIVVDPRIKPYGYDAEEADKQIAVSIDTLT